MSKKKKIIIGAVAAAIVVIAVVLIIRCQNEQTEKEKISKSNKITTTKINKI